MSAPSYPASSDVVSGQATLAAHYNNLRADALRLGAPVADARNIGDMLGRYSRHVTLQYLATNKVRVPFSAARPPALVVNGYMLEATANVDLPAAPTGSAAKYYVFANRTTGSTIFTLSVNTSATEGSDQRLIGSFFWDGSNIVQTSISGEETAGAEALMAAPLFGTGADGVITNLSDADTNAITIAQTSSLNASHNRLFRALGNITITQPVTVGRQNGQARGLFPTTHGSAGISLGAILAAIGSKGIPSPIRPGGGSNSLCGGVVQFISGGTVTINDAISATGTNAASEGGGGGGLVVIVSHSAIAGSGGIDVSGAAGHATAAGRGGAGGYSGESGGHAGYGGSGGGRGASGSAQTGGAAGAGYLAGKAGGGVGTSGGLTGGGGGGCLEAAGADGADVGGAGGAGASILGQDAALAHGYLRLRALAAASANGGTAGYAGGSGGAFGGGGGGGGGSTSGTAGAGGAAQSTNPVGAGGGGGGRSTSGGAGGNGGAGSNGCPDLYALSSTNIYAGLPGGQGGGGGGGGGRGATAGGSGGAGGTGAAGRLTTDFHSASNTGAGAGGAGANGTAGGNGSTSAGGAGGAGGDGGNGGGAAGLVLLIAPSITYSGVVTGMLVKIEGADALQFIEGFGL